MDPPILHVRMLGGMDLRLGERSLPALDSARVESLLGYLLLHRSGPQPRQHLAFVLWPDSTEPQARTNLRKVLDNLRRALPDADRFMLDHEQTGLLAEGITGQPLDATALERLYGRQRRQP